MYICIYYTYTYIQVLYNLKQLDYNYVEDRHMCLFQAVYLKQHCASDDLFFSSLTKILHELVILYI